MSQYNYSLRIAQNVIQQDKDLSDFIQQSQESFSSMILEENRRNWEIYNMDQTGLPVELPPTKIIAEIGARTTHIKTKGRATFPINNCI